VQRINIDRFYFFAIAILLLSSCAQVVPPSGGPKDTVPPKPLSFQPENKSTHFNSHKILIKFNKYIQLKDINTQLVISPPLKHFPNVIIKRGKELEITLKDTLLDNTTYTFNFGNSICDITEANPIPNFHYVFSTGDHLDSLTLSGQLIDAFSCDIQKDALVMLYADLDDSAIYKKLPTYLAHSDAGGHYKIENIKPGTYRLVALSKSNGDYFYHPYGESIGFRTKPIDIEKNDTANLSLFIEQEPKLHLLKARARERGRITLAFNIPADSLSIKLLNLPSGSAPFTLLQYSVTHDTVTYWINSPTLDSLRMIISRNNKVIDTAAVYSIPQPVQSKKAVKPIPLRLNANVHERQTDFDYHNPITLQSDRPIIAHSLDKIRLVQRKDTVHFTIDTAKLPFSVALKANFISDSSYTLFVPPNTFTDLFGLVNDTLNVHFKIIEPTYFGSLPLTIKIKSPAFYLLQLLDDKGNVTHSDTLQSSKIIHYDAIAPGNYRLRLIQDANHDGKWTTGNYLKGIQPEKVFYFPQTITIRSNWDLTQDWIVQ
jgi:uncharacterized protein (DUF2141 family)